MVRTVYKYLKYFPITVHLKTYYTLNPLSIDNNDFSFYYHKILKFTVKNNIVEF